MREAFASRIFGTIEKRSSEVWQLLSAVKTEFGNYSGMLQKAQNNIQTGLNQLEDVVGKRIPKLRDLTKTPERCRHTNRRTGKHHPPRTNQWRNVR
ncbi:MAG: hypothetical protein ABIO55_07950 [Ginsengibacter sp.]